MDPRRKRLIYRCQHLGTKENDILVGRFAAAHAAGMTDEQVARLEALLDESNNDLYDWITGKALVPADHDHDVMAWLKKFNHCA